MGGLVGNILGPYLPNAGASSSSETSKEYTFTAGLNQTEYDLSAAPHNLTVQPNSVDVFLNETKLVGDNKPGLNGFVVTLQNAPFQNSIITIRTFY